jgi:hypothetical protein
MRVPTKNSRQALWADIDTFAICAIELATGVIFSRRFAPPTGLWSTARDLKADCDRRWPGPEGYTIGQMSRQYLRSRVEHLEELRDGAATERGDSRDTD